MYKFSLILGKISAVLLSLVGKKGGSFPGKLALKYSPDILKKFNYPKITILVTGTNGKTSITNMLSYIFEKAGYDVASNLGGDNIINGIVTLCIKNSDLNFNIQKEIFVIEIDELTLAKNLKDIGATCVVINNLFVDQLDRIGQEDYIVKRIKEALKDYKKDVIFCADDPWANSIKCEDGSFKTLNFGIDYTNFEQDDKKIENEVCQNCGNILDYENVYYDHMGRYHCNNCNFSNEKIDYKVQSVQEDSFILNGNKYYYSIPVKYHLYNTLCAITVAKEHNIKDDDINAITKNFTLGKGRMENVKVGDKKVLVNMVKNLTGANETIDFISKKEGKTSILFVLNDYIADGKDIAWIYDCEFEKIKNLKNIITTGKRPYELALRFKYGNFKNDINIIPTEDINVAVAELLKNDGNLYALSSYTGMNDLRKALRG